MKQDSTLRTVEGDLAERDRFVRSLRPAGVLETISLFLTHQDKVLHHTHPQHYMRPFRRTAVPGAVLIDFREYLAIVRDVVLARPTDHRALGSRTPA